MALPSAATRRVRFALRPADLRRFLASLLTIARSQGLKGASGLKRSRAWYALTKALIYISGPLGELYFPQGGGRPSSTLLSTLLHRRRPGGSRYMAAASSSISSAWVSGETSG